MNTWFLDSKLSTCSVQCPFNKDLKEFAELFHRLICDSNESPITIEIVILPG